MSGARKYQQLPLVDEPTEAKLDRHYRAEVWVSTFPHGSMELRDTVEVEAGTPEFAAELVWTMMTRTPPYKMTVCDVVVLTTKETGETLALECDFTHWNPVDMPKERTG